MERLLVDLNLNSNSYFLKKLIPPDYLYQNGTFRKVTREGINYNLDISHVVEHYIYFGISDSDYSTLIDSIQNAKVILDIGANICSKSMLFSTLNPSARILSFEPHPVTYKKALANLKLNHFENIELHNLGLGDKKEVVKLFEVNQHNPGMNRILNHDTEFPYIEIEVDLLETVMLQNAVDKIDFVKIDVEGYEYAVLKGGEEIIKLSKPIIFLELDDKNLKENSQSASQLIELLESFGYNKFIRADQNLEVNSKSNLENCHFDLIAEYEGLE